MTFAPDGRHLVSRTAAGVARVWNLENPEELAPQLGEVPPSGGQSGLYGRWTEWSPNGTRIAMLDLKYMCYIYDAATGKRPCLLRCVTRNRQPKALNPDPN